MAEVILMPRLSDTMTEGVVAAWHKNVGDYKSTIY
jgi:pyruvate dehydrogenase E2 component (dihydrolipoamide acetyltransferase)